jgi:hypothetical protein
MDQSLGDGYLWRVIMKSVRLTDRLGLVRVTVVTSLVLAVGVLLPGGALATHGAAAAAPETIITGTHRCENFGGNSGAGFRAGHCADIDQFVNSIGLLAVRGQGQAFCQRVSDAVIVQCAGISQKITITNASTGETISSNPVCGRYGGSACPTGRFQNLSPGIYAYCSDTYYATVRTTIVLPVDAQISRSDDFTSFATTLVC